MNHANRPLVVLCDGTNNNLTGGHKDTNVVKLCELMAAAPDGAQQVFYDPGVGNPGELPGATLVDGWNRFSERVASLAFGRGVYENIAESYLYLMRHYQSGDAIFIFGFSRGAFTARSLAGLVNQFGILQPHMESMVPTLIHIYFSDRALAPEAAKAITGQASRLFVTQASRNVEIQFVGVWDTVASVGMWPFNGWNSRPVRVHAGPRQPYAWFPGRQPRPGSRLVLSAPGDPPTRTPTTTPTENLPARRLRR